FDREVTRAGQQRNVGGRTGGGGRTGADERGQCEHAGEENSLVHAQRYQTVLSPTQLRNASIAHSRWARTRSPTCPASPATRAASLPRRRTSLPRWRSLQLCTALKRADVACSSLIICTSMRLGVTAYKVSPKV